jgi:hypothetical protein
MKKTQKNRKGCFFISGLLFGFLIGISIFFINKHLFPEKLHLLKPQVNLQTSETLTENVPAKETKVAVHNTVSKHPKVDTTTLNITSLPEQYIEEWDEEDVEFSIQPEKVEEIVILDKILNNREITVKVKQRQEDPPVSPPISIFEVQQWSTPIKNSIIYQNTAGILKIKGMDINAIEIFFVQGNYYLYNGTHYYNIKENKSYEKLVIADHLF